MKFSKIFLAALISFFAVISSTAQLVVDNTLTIDQIVNDILLGDGIDATNITFNGMPGDMVNVQVGRFNSENSNIPINTGVIMATGNATVAIGPNDGGGVSNQDGYVSVSGDPDLEQLVGIDVNDVAIIEFDFVASSDSLKFEYVFASEEYNEFVCAGVNDVFGFFLSGGSINGEFSNNAINIALIPGTDIPVSINTVNNGEDPDSQGLCEALDPNWQDNAIYFVDNESNNDPNSTQFDGFTVVLTALADVDCGETYHIKLAIGDGGTGDTVWDSAVFLEEGSFSSFGEVFASFAPVFGDEGGSVTQEGFDSIAVAGCTDPVIELVRPTGALFDTIYFDLGGSALLSPDASGPGDYWIPEGFPTGFPSGVDTVNFTIETINPNITDTLDIQLLIYFTGCGGELDSTVVEIPIAPPPQIDALVEDITIVCATDSLGISANAEGGLLPHIYDWIDLEDYPDPSGRIVPLPDDFLEYTVRVTDQCEFVYDTASFVVTNAVPPPVAGNIEQFSDPTCPNEPVEISSNIFDGTTPYLYNWSDSRGSTYGSTESILIENLHQVVEAFNPTLDVDLIVIDACGDSLVLPTSRVTYPEFDSLSVSFTPLFDNCPETAVELESIVSGGAGDYTYNWGIEGESTFTDGFGPSTSNTFIDAGGGFNTFSLLVQDRCNRAGHDMIRSVSQDGTLLFSGEDTHEQTIPYIRLDPLPNIITPNGDGLNEVFVVPGIDAFEDASVLIYDRWGKLIYESSSYDAGTGEATVSQGFSADGFSDGTYLYIVNIDSGECVTQGNLEVVRGSE